MEKVEIRSARGPQSVGPYSQGLRVGEWVFFSGQIPLDSSGALIEGDAKRQTEQVMENIGILLEAAGCTFQNVVKSTVYLIDLADFAAMNEVYASHFQQPYPVRSTVQVAALPKGARVEIEVMVRL